jgi:UDP-4-amino-4,6-dideoxy-N-acetyl-beta-L-altrosamine N-acetyltransferase
MSVKFENILNGSENLKELVRTWRNTKQVSQYMITNHFISVEEHQRWLEKLKTNSSAKAWIIIYNNAPVGLVSLTNINMEKKTAEWGFYIAEESARGKGVGSTTLYKLMKYVFNTLRFEKLSTLVLQNNDVAMKMYDQFGFKKDNAEKQHLQRNGAIIDVISLSISQKKWKKVQGTLKHHRASNLM